MTNREHHWNSVYQAKQPDAVSWYQPALQQSLRLIREFGIAHDAPIIDLGGGASTLVDDLLDEGYTTIRVLDISIEALNRSKTRLGCRADSVTWIVSDVTQCDLPAASIALWHDRAVFHFLVSEDDRAAYRALLAHAVRPGGIVIIATFGPNGPLKCSGLEICRYSPATLHAAVGPCFDLLDSFVEQHTTAFQTTQEFLYAIFRRNV